jgi:hypothetical protein
VRLVALLLSWGVSRREKMSVWILVRFKRIIDQWMGLDLSCFCSRTIRLITSRRKVLKLWRECYTYASCSDPLGVGVYGCLCISMCMMLRVSWGWSGIRWRCQVFKRVVYGNPKLWDVPWGTWRWIGKWRVKCVNTFIALRQITGVRCCNVAWLRDEVWYTIFDVSVKPAWRLKGKFVGSQLRLQTYKFLRGP